jgi:hypothetical protein
MLLLLRQRLLPAASTAAASAAAYTAACDCHTVQSAAAVKGHTFKMSHESATTQWLRQHCCCCMQAKWRGMSLQFGKLTVHHSFQTSDECVQQHRCLKSMQKG